MELTKNPKPDFDVSSKVGVGCFALGRNRSLNKGQAAVSPTALRTPMPRRDTAGSTLISSDSRKDAPSVVIIQMRESCSGDMAVGIWPNSNGGGPNRNTPFVCGLSCGFLCA